MPSAGEQSTDDICAFLDLLPPELRNEIYKLVLIRDDSDPAHEITSSGISEPSLLQTCKRICHEGAHIYYSQTLSIAMAGYDPYVLLKWEEKRKAVKKTYDVKPKAEFSFVPNPPQPNWQHLHLWLKYVYEGRTSIVIPPISASVKEAGIEKSTLDIMFSIARKCQDTPWDEVDEMLQLAHSMLTTLYHRWE